MGYCSDVSLVMTRESFGDMMSKIPDSVTELVKFADRFESQGDSIMILWEGIKWYQDTAPISHVVSFLDSLDIEKYHLIEIGESHDHIMESGGFWGNPFETCINRSIGFCAGKPIELSAFT
jgi:hypothetical protein